MVGQYNLIFPDLYEREFQVVNVMPNENYESTYKKYDIALLEVRMDCLVRERP